MKSENVVDNVKTGCREFYDKEGKIIKSYAREILNDENFVKEHGKQVPWMRIEVISKNNF